MGVLLNASLTLALGLAVPGAAAQQLTAKPLPDNKPCTFPAAAQKQRITGPVRFVARISPEGTTESVEIRTVPLPNLGFEEAVRSCVANWRFEPVGDGESGLRSYEGAVRYRFAPTEEAAVRQLLESLAAAWNTGDKGALEELETRREEVPGLATQAEHFLQNQVQAAGATEKCRVALDADLSYLRFLLSDRVEVRQSFACVATAGAGEPPPPAGVRTLDLTAAKGPRGWRFVSLSEADKARLSAPRVGGTIREPKKLKDVKPVYPEWAKEARIQGIVVLECVISTEGDVIEVKVLRSVPDLDEAAIRAVRKWKYTPTLLDGKPVPVIMVVTVSFKLS